MVDVSSKKCITCNLKQPCFNYPNEKQPLYCNNCKQCGMDNIRDKKYIACNLKPSFNYPNEKRIVL